MVPRKELGLQTQTYTNYQEKQQQAILVTTSYDLPICQPPFGFQVSVLLSLLTYSLYSLPEQERYQAHDTDQCPAHNAGVRNL